MFAPPLCVLPDNSNVTFIAPHAPILQFMTYETLEIERSTGTAARTLMSPDLPVMGAKVWPARLDCQLKQSKSGYMFAKQQSDVI